MHDGDNSIILLVVDQRMSSINDGWLVFIRLWHNSGFSCCWISIILRKGLWDIYINFNQTALVDQNND